MKNVFKITMLSFVLVLSSCSKESSIDTQGETEDLLFSNQVNSSAKEQTPLSQFDTAQEGIYVGLIAAAYTQDRGKIWINAANNGVYNAHAEMIGGEVISFVEESGVSVSTNRIRRFAAPNASFILDLSEDTAIVKEVVYNNEPYFIEIVKATSTRMPIAMTGTFNDPETPYFNGTWNFITSGTNSNATAGLEDLSLLMTTYHGYEFTDTIFETYDFICESEPSFIPALNTDGDIFASGQTSNLSGLTTWSLIYKDGTYRIPNCTTVASGKFAWSDANEAYDGDIYID